MCLLCLYYESLWELGVPKVSFFNGSSFHKLYPAWLNVQRSPNCTLNTGYELTVVAGFFFYSAAKNSTSTFFSFI